MPSYKSLRIAEKPTKEINDRTFKLVSSDAPAAGAGEVLVKVLYLSCDPAQRTWIQKGADPSRSYMTLPSEGDVMPARALCEVVGVGEGVEKWHEGDKVMYQAGWTEYALAKADALTPAPAAKGQPETVALGALGSIGLTAHWGLLHVGQATKETKCVVVSGAAGATGSMVVQIAKKVLGISKVIGLAGGPEKCRHVETLGADACIDYKSGDWKQQLREVTGAETDIYFDNVGGEILDEMLPLVKRYGTVVVCGAISAYNNLGAGQTLKNWFEIISNRLRVQGFVVLDGQPQFGQMIGELKGWIEAGKITLDKSETIKQATIEQVPETYNLLFTGGNTGKLIIELQHS